MKKVELGPIEQLEQNLDRQRYLLEEMVDLLNRQKKSILFNDVGQLNDSVERIQELLPMLNQVERDRRSAVQDYARLHQLPVRELSLSRLLSHSGHSGLSDAGTRVRKLVNEVEGLNRLNVYLLNKSQRFIRRNLEWLLHLRTPDDTTYDRKKRVTRGRSLEKQLVNRTV